jgi:spore germination protein KB
MEKVKKIPMYQLVCLITISKIMHEYTYLPVINTIPDNQDSWIEAILSIPYIILMSLPILFLINKFKNTTFFDMMTKIWSNIGGRIIVFIIVLFFLFCNIACLSLSVVFIKNHLFFNTPPILIALSIIIPACYIAIKGIVTICRMSVLIFIAIMLTVIFFFILGFSQMDFSLILPIMGDSSFLEINIGSIIEAARFSDILLLFALYYHLKNVNDSNKTLLYSLLYITFLILMILIPVITVLGLDFAKHAWNPYYMFTRQVEAYDFIQRVEIFNVVCWLVGSIIKIAIYIYLEAYYLSKIFNKKDYKVIAVIMSFVSIIILSVLGLDRSFIVEILRSDRVFPYIVIFFILFLPLITLLLYLIRRKKINNKISTA